MPFRRSSVCGSNTRPLWWTGLSRDFRSLPSPFRERGRGEIGRRAAVAFCETAEGAKGPSVRIPRVKRVGQIRGTEGEVGERRTFASLRGLARDYPGIPRRVDRARNDIVGWEAAA